MQVDYSSLLVMITDLGEPVDLITILQKDWDTRLKVRKWSYLCSPIIICICILSFISLC